MSPTPRTPSSIAGSVQPAAGDVRPAQGPSGFKAFMEGVAAASSGALGVAAIGEAMFGRGARKAAYQRALEDSLVTQYIQDYQGKSAPVARHEAAKITDFLRRRDAGVISQNAQNLLDEVAGVRAGSNETNLFAVEKMFPGKSKPEVRKIYRDQVNRFADGPKAPVRPEVAPGSLDEVLRQLRTRYKPQGGARLRAKVWGRRLGPMVAGTAPLAIYGGFDAWRRSRDQAREARR